MRNFMCIFKDDTIYKGKPNMIYGMSLKMTRFGNKDQI